MKNNTLKILTVLLFIVLLVIGMMKGTKKSSPVKIKVLILPKFEVGEMSGDDPGEAQDYYEAYCQGGEEYNVTGEEEDQLYVKDGIALFVTGMGKVNSSLSVTSVLTDDRFDFSNALILSVGCAGSAKEYGVMGDVYVITATVDGDLGHKADSREFADQNQSTTWYHDEEYDSDSHKVLDQDLVSQVYDLVKDVKIDTTENTRKYMSDAFDGADWAMRDPQVLRGTSFTADDYWKGETGHNNALLAIETYDCPDSYAATEMEDNAVAVAVDRLGLLNHLVILRDSVNTDVFMNGATPESLWDPDYDATLTDSETETADIFETAMKNNYKVGKVVIDAYLNGTLSIK